MSLHSSCKFVLVSIYVVVSSSTDEAARAAIEIHEASSTYITMLSTAGGYIMELEWYYRYCSDILCGFEWTLNLFWDRLMAHVGDAWANVVGPLEWTRKAEHEGISTLGCPYNEQLLRGILSVDRRDRIL